MEQTQELLQKWDDRARRLYPRMEISGEGLLLGAGTVLAGMTKDERGRPRLALGDEPRALALLATAYERSVDVRLLAKLRRAAELWTEVENALAHIHLAYAKLAPCEEVQALRLFVADELVEAGVTPETLMKAQGFDPTPLALLKANFNPAQPRWPAGDGRDSGRWSGGGAVTPVSYRERARMKALRTLLEWLRSRLKGSKHETPPEKAPPIREEKKPAVKPFESVESDLPRPGYGKEVSIPGLPDDIKGIDTTKPHAGMANYDVDLSQSEFESELSQLGWTKEPSSDGKVMNYTKDGARYSVREFSRSTERPTAEFFHPFSSRSDADMKLRLRKD
ncbi:MAG: hypothetical protein WBD65_13580 [Methylocella sp.]